MKITVIGDSLRDVYLDVVPKVNYEGATSYEIVYSFSMMGGSGLLCQILSNMLGIGKNIHFFAPKETVAEKIRFNSFRLDKEFPATEKDINNHLHGMDINSRTIKESDCVILSDYSRGGASKVVRDFYYDLNLCTYTISTARDCYDEDADLWIVNRREFNKLFKEFEEVPMINGQSVCITNGSLGVTVREADTWKVYNIDSNLDQAKVKSVVGAGDAFVAYLAVNRNDFEGAQRFAEEFIQIDKKELLGKFQ